MSNRTTLVCGGCRRKIEIGDLYIEDTPSGFMGKRADPLMDGLLSDILGGDATLSGGAGGKVIYCEDCTQPGGQWRLTPYYGEEADGEPPSQAQQDYDEFMGRQG